MSYPPRTIKLDTPERRKLALAAIEHAPDGIEIELREPKKLRSPDANSLMWAGPLKDIAEQAYVNGRPYSAEIWHEFLKNEYLIDENDPYIFEHVKDVQNYRKYDYNPIGERILVGSTTQLTKYGFSLYLEAIYAHGASLGIMFHSNPKDLQK